MSNDQQPDPAPGGVRTPGPQGSWGGEYDSDATAFIELPEGYQERSGAEPLAAPGHGYQPPEIGDGAAAAAPHADPSASGQWTLPFGQADPAAVERSARAAAMGQGAAALAGGHDAGPWAGGEGAPGPWSTAPAGEPHPAEPAGAPEGGEPWAAEPAVTGTRSDHPEVSYVLRVNGVERPVTGAWIGESLLYVLRERLGLAGAKDGCSQGECGACSVQVDGRLVAACLVPAATAAGSEIRTVEGLGSDGAPSDVQRALAATSVQCGFCLPGIAMTVHDLLEGNHSPTDLETRQAICGNLCRCSGYGGVLDAVRSVVDERAATAARAAEEAEHGAQGGGPGTRIPHQAGPPAGGTL
ncbi:(2Fe-2S)-binding protein [Streptomyces hainanensis]|uniref:2Fe-2S iron-sulfur cluster binding domain-containing protein n=1 Tax=Streptomyces hainanensis TaxID=402648 RepID=A0A4R4SRN6_9ACTN|nr:2Fe-2S iron-sulfur cluster binding domain-containing protein [Streptomyces hainanensis]